MNSWRKDLSLLREPGVGLLFAGRTLNTLGMSFAPVALSFGILGLPGGSASLLSIVLAAESIPLVLFLLVGGALADRLPRQRVIMASQVLASVSYTALASLIALGVANAYALCAAAVLSGVGAAMGFPAFTGLIPQIVAPDRLQTGNALLSFCAAVARIAGVVAGGVVTAVIGGAGGLGVSALMYALTAATAVRLHPRYNTGARDVVPGLVSDMKEGWREFVSREWLWVVVAAWSLLNMCFNAAHAVLGPVIAKERLGGAEPWSWVLAAESVGEVIAVFVAMRWRPRHPLLKPLIITMIAMPAPFTMLGLSAPLWAIIVASAPMGLAFMVFDAMGSFMLGPVGLLIAGPLAAHVGAAPATFGCGVLMFLIAGVALFSRDVRTLEWSEATSGPDRTPELVSTPVEVTVSA
ncbi:MFS transporter [Propionibacterium freudenreichii]|uniref:MFS transporter n=1 Tax=Propionibacterium freudenreichii TaxID=1744 RepID=UPI0010216604|nr:MFS transporter [Propionibacterium freudenreichii]MDK9646266.1 MFS transporter [Propionibacterium freudenreichii]MDK9654833.1 MFS transporter [Propionibacterium freudenreichii]MDK9667094.1 MFS transporter [Propionibacterium freudenreichii]